MTTNTPQDKLDDEHNTSSKASRFGFIDYVVFGFCCMVLVAVLLTYLGSRVLS